MLEPSFLSKVAEFTCADPEFERILFRARSSGAMYRVTTVHSVDLLYFNAGTRY